MKNKYTDLVSRISNAFVLLLIVVLSGIGLIIYIDAGKNDLLAVGKTIDSSAQLLSIHEVSRSLNLEQVDNTLFTIYDKHLNTETLKLTHKQFSVLMAVLNITDDALSQSKTEEFNVSAVPMQHLLVTSSKSPVSVMQVKQNLAGVKKAWQQAQQGVHQQLAMQNSYKVIIACIMLLSIITGGVFIFWQLIYHIKAPLKGLLKAVQKTSSGQLHLAEVPLTNGEIKDLVEGVNAVLESQANALAFARQIGNGNLDEQPVYINGEDKLGKSLVLMHTKLQKQQAEEKTRTWAIEGLAIFAELLRADQHSFTELSDKVLAKLLAYLSANQGALYVIESDEAGVEYLNQIATFAWGKKKYEERRIEIGQGLAGMCVKEKETLYRTEIPASYVRITSGLGQATPTSLLIVPLILNQKVYGVVEIASFKGFEKYEIEFVEKVAESVASVISAHQVNAHTQRLLAESRQKTESLRVIEEELRQNAEELEATQEGLQQRLNDARFEMEKQIREIEAEKRKNIAILEGSVDAVIMFNSRGEIEFFNKAAEEIWQQGREQVLGKKIGTLLPVELYSLQEGYQVNYVDCGVRKPVDVRTEVNCQSQSGEEMSLLLTLSQAKVGNEYTFALFIQSISVELF